MRRSVTVGKAPWVVLLLALVGPVANVEAGPFLTHPLSTDAGGQGPSSAPAPLVPGMPSSFPNTVERDDLRAQTLNELGYSAGLPAADSGAGAGVSAQVRLSHPAGRVAPADLVRVVPVRAARLPAASDLAENPKRSIPEPASAILFVTGLGRTLGQSPSPPRPWGSGLLRVRPRHPARPSRRPRPHRTPGQARPPAGPWVSVVNDALDRP